MNIKMIAQRHPLSGTPKQKEWAQIIRAKKIQQLEKIALTGILKLIRPHLTSEILDQMGCTTHKKMIQLGWWICEVAIQSEEASWWIKTREEKPEDWISSAAAICIPQWTQTKPFV